MKIHLRVNIAQTWYETQSSTNYYWQQVLQFKKCKFICVLISRHFGTKLRVQPIIICNKFRNLKNLSHKNSFAC